MDNKFRKKPVVIEAHHWLKNGDHPNDYDKDHEGLENGALRIFSGAERKANKWEGDVVRYYRHPDVPGEKPCEQCGKPHHVHGWIDTLEQGHRVCPGDWIITGVKGERYPCKPDIFEATYERASNPASPAVCADFEEWAKAKNFDMDAREGAYESLLTAAAWEAFQAARAASPAPVAAIPTWQERRGPSVDTLNAMELEIRDLRAALSTAPQAQAAQPDNVHELDAAMSLLRVARKIDASKVSPAALRKQLVESVAIAEGAEGEGEEYIFADVYENLSSMIAPYVNGGEPDAMRPFPASVVDTFTMLLEHYLATATPAAPAATSEQDAKDAARYRWLRNEAWAGSACVHDPRGFRCFHEGLDEIVDAAMRPAAPAAPDEG